MNTSSFNEASFKTPTKNICRNDQEEPLVSDINGIETNLDLLTSTSSLLPLHSQTTLKSHEDMECYFLSLYQELLPIDEAKKFWIEAHYYSALRKLSLCSTPAQTKIDFRWDDSPFSTSSTCVNESLGLILQRETTKIIVKPNNEGDISKTPPIFPLGPNKNCYSTSNLFSLSAALSNLSLAKSTSKNNYSQKDDAAISIGRLALKKFENNSSINVFTPAKQKQDLIETPSKSTYEKITNTPKKLASAFARGLTGGITSILASYDIVDDPEYYDPSSTSYTPSQNDTTMTSVSDERQLQENEQQLLNSKRLIPVADDVVLVNTELAADCCLLLLDYIKSFDSEEALKHENGCSQGFVIVQNKVIMFQNGDQNSSPSWTELCHHVGEYYQSCSDKILKKRSWKNQAQAKILSEIMEFDANILALALLSVSVIQTNDESTLLFFSINDEQSQNTEKLTKVEEALFDLICTQQSLLTRIAVVEKDIEKDTNKAVHYQKKKNTKLALIQLKKRKMKHDQLDRYSGALLNVEMVMESLRRSLTDSETKNVLETYKDAMKSMRETNEYDIETVDKLMEDLRDESDNMEDIRDVMSKDFGSFGVSAGGNDDLERELRQLEEEMEQDEGNEGDGGNNEADEKKTLKGKENILSLEERLKNLNKPILKEGVISKKTSREALSSI